MPETTPPQPAAKPAAGWRIPLVIGAVLAGAVIGYVGVSSLKRAPSGDIACNSAVDLAKKIAPLAHGEVAALTMASTPLRLPDLAFEDASGQPKKLSDFRGKTLRTIVNGEVKQESTTDEMEWDMHYLVADIARTITLYPGDVLLSGTPANSRTVYPGDVVEVEVEGLGKLTNHIISGPTPIRTDVGAQPSESEEVLSTAQGGDWEFRGIRPPRR